MIKLAGLFFIPGGLLFASAELFLRFAEFPAHLRFILPHLPDLVCAAGALLGWRFNRSRLIFALLVLTLSNHALQIFSDGIAHRVCLLAVSLLLPLNFGIFSLLRQCGIFNRWGVVRLGLIAGQPLVIAWLYFRDPAVLLSWLEYPLFSLQVLDRFPLPQPALLSVSIMLLLLFVRFLFRPQPLEAGFFWALAAVVPALVSNADEVGHFVWFAMAGTILAISIIEVSYRMAFRDELTGLPARRALNETLQKIAGRYVVAMVDIDHFKKVNDRHGHDVGDQVLKMVASKLGKVSGGGKAFRYGGEEFTILFPGKEPDEAKAHLERLREAVAESTFTLRHRSRPRKKPQGKPVKKGERKLVVTVSIGVAGRNGRQSRPAEVVKAADQALYRAKKQGRNRVCG